MEHLQVEDPASEVNKELLLRLLPKLNYPALLQAVEQIAPHVDGGLPPLPEQLPSTFEQKDDLLALLHKMLFDIHLMDGTLVCPGTGRKFPVKDSIPNMLLHADEI